MADEAEQKKMAAQLLAAEDDSVKPVAPPSPKRNSKDRIRADILKVVEKYQLDFPYSDTKLKRMNKEQLTRLLAEVMEAGVKQDMARQVGVDPSAPQALISLGALRMVHNIAARGVERAWNTFAVRPTGLAVEGFADSLAHPEVAKTVDECLMEIAEANPEVLQYFESPYSRLALIWVGVLSSTLKKAHVQQFRPGKGQRAPPRRPGGGRSEEKRQVDGTDEPRVKAV